jgi:hypothetical protein
VLRDLPNLQSGEAISLIRQVNEALSLRLMHAGHRDVAQIRLDNALALFDEFVHNTVKHPDAATLRGLERRFAERLQIQPSYWSQIKGRSRQIGERLARQFEQLCHKPYGWMDQPHDATPAVAAVATPRPDDNEEIRTLPQDDDEKFIVGLVLSYYRRHPQRARTRLLDLLGEVLTPTPPAPPPPSPPATGRGAAATTSTKKADDTADLWARTLAGAAPLKQKKR